MERYKTCGGRWGLGGRSEIHDALREGSQSRMLVRLWLSGRCGDLAWLSSLPTWKTRVPQ